jgi:hypothetical protein
MINITFLNFTPQIQIIAASMEILFQSLYAICKMLLFLSAQKVWKSNTEQVKALIAKNETKKLF